MWKLLTIYFIVMLLCSEWYFAPTSDAKNQWSKCILDTYLIWPFSEKNKAFESGRYICVRVSSENLRGLVRGNLLQFLGERFPFSSGLPEIDKDLGC